MTAESSRRSSPSSCACPSHHRDTKYQYIVPGCRVNTSILTTGAPRQWSTCAWICAVTVVCILYSAGSVLTPTAATRLCSCTGSVVACTAGTPLRQGGGASSVPPNSVLQTQCPQQCRCRALVGGRYCCTHVPRRTCGVSQITPLRSQQWNLPHN